jgi:hypothetical protein|uniref:Uncharacterized protein n=1 Tax=Eutreptiella gymnastica TaxID=73025 RepID=A0A7S4FYD7_9EUGL
MGHGRQLSSHHSETCTITMQCWVTDTVKKWSAGANQLNSLPEQCEETVLLHAYAPTPLRTLVRAEHLHPNISDKSTSWSTATLKTLAVKICRAVRHWCRLTLKHPPLATPKPCWLEAMGRVLYHECLVGVSEWELSLHDSNYTLQYNTLPTNTTAEPFADTSAGLAICSTCHSLGNYDHHVLHWTLFLLLLCCVAPSGADSVCLFAKPAARGSGKQLEGRVLA